jgi:hypothetical protein
MVTEPRSGMTPSEPASRLRAGRAVTLSALWLAAALQGCAPPPPAQVEWPAGCTLDGIALEEIAADDADPTEWHGRLDLPDRPELWGPAEPDELLTRFRTALARRLGMDPDARALVERQRAIFAAMEGEWRGEATNATRLLDGDAGTIHPISCLEAMLWKWQAARYPMLEHPTEFGAFVLRGPDRVRVYLSSADLVGQRIRGAVTERVRADIEAGFRLVIHIHNHPFLFDREVGDRMWTVEATRDDVAGALAPSMTDVQFYRRLRDSHGLEAAWVTNGIETSRFRAAEFETLRAAAP